MKILIKRFLKYLGLEISKGDPLLDLMPTDYLRSPYLPRVYDVSIRRILYFKDMLEMVRNIDGDIVECGVSIGHGLLYFALLSDLIGKERRIYGFDSFEGFPGPIEQDGKTPVRKGDYATPMSFVWKVFLDGRVKESTIKRIHLLKGYFDETLSAYQGKIAFLHLDCDLYESYKKCFQKLYDCVCLGGVILFDEYDDTNFVGAKKAIDEFFQDKSEKIDKHCYGKYFVIKNKGA